ncbi:MAG TPA: hypothetical protein DIT04_09055 [Dysgonomonas sp.]|nr:hypothetical protein [Dysgonomonas sp.]
MRQFLVYIFILVSVWGINAQNTDTPGNTEQPIAADIIEKPAVSGEAGSIALQAQAEYQEGNYRKAIELLEAEIEAQKENGKVSAQLYYNLGNAYFRVNEFPEAILNYERAQLFDPGDRDIRHNIKYANTKIEDKILTADNFIFQIWFDSIQNLLTSNTWGVISIIFFIIFVSSLFLFFFSPRLVLKKAGFYSGIVMLVLLLFTNVFAIRQKRKIENRNTAIVMAGSAPVVSSPTSSGSKELFILHAGTKVRINKSDGNWYEIEIADGNVGWIQKERIEVI